MAKSKKRKIVNPDDIAWGSLLSWDTFSPLMFDALTIDDVSASDVSMPEVPQYSGRISTRIAPHIHRQAAQLAAEQGISLNQYISDAIVAMNYQLMGIKRTVPVMERTMDDYRKKLNFQAEQTVSESGTWTEERTEIIRRHTTKSR